MFNFLFEKNVISFFYALALEPYEIGKAIFTHSFVMHSIETQQVLASLFLPFLLLYLLHACQSIALLSLIIVLNTVLEIEEAETVSIKMSWGDLDKIHSG